MYKMDHTVVNVWNTLLDCKKEEDNKSESRTAPTVLHQRPFSAWVTQGFIQINGSKWKRADTFLLNTFLEARNFDSTTNGVTRDRY